jgi:hypothetical protein
MLCCPITTPEGVAYKRASPLKRADRTAPRQHSQPTRHTVLARGAQHGIVPANRPLQRWYSDPPTSGHSTRRTSRRAQLPPSLQAASAALLACRPPLQRWYSNPPTPSLISSLLSPFQRASHRSPSGIRTMDTPPSTRLTTRRRANPHDEPRPLPPHPKILQKPKHHP